MLRVALIVALACQFNIAARSHTTFAADADVVLTVNPGVGLERKLSLADLSRLPRRSIRATDESGKESLFEGVLLAEVLKSAGQKFGTELGGKALANYLLVEAADGYRAIFALPELDATFTDAIVLLADHRDGEPLEEREGPLRMIVPHEKRHARWVRRVIALYVRNS